MKKIIITVIAVIFIEIIAVIIIAFSGIPDVSATKPEGSFAKWFLNTTKDHSIHSRAERIVVPSLNDSSLIALGFEHYHGMCESCHGAPGERPDELAAGLNPPAPDLGISTTDLSPGELFIIIKDGIKMTGMPAWGSTHSDSTIWAMVAFLQHLQTLTPETYKKYQNALTHGSSQTVDYGHGRELR